MTSQTGLPDSLLFQDRQRGRGSHPLLCGETNYTHNTSPTTARVKLWGHLVTLNSQRLSENQNSFPSWGANKTVPLCKHQETRLTLIYFYDCNIDFWFYKGWRDFPSFCEVCCIVDDDWNNVNFSVRFEDLKLARAANTYCNSRFVFGWEHIPFFNYVWELAIC